MKTQNLPFTGKVYLFDYNGFVARDTFTEDEVIYEVIAGPAKGVTGRARFTSRQVSDTQYLITWQEEDGGTVVHLDDFARGVSYSHYTSARHDFFVMDGTISEVTA